MSFRKPRIKFGTTSNSIYLENEDNNKLLIHNNDIDVIAISGVTSQTTLQIKSSEPRFEITNTDVTGNPYAEMSLGITNDGDKWKLTGGLEDKTDSDFNFHIIKNNDEYLTINDNGNIGIGITNPNYKLEVNGAANIKDNCFVQGNLILKGITAGTSEITDNLWTENEFSIYSNNSINVGVGVTNPSNKLEVDGSIGLSGNILPLTNNLYDIGSSNEKFNNIYITQLNVEDIEIKKLSEKLNINNATRIAGNLDVEGDLNVYGNAITFDTETIQVEDGLIQLASNNSADVIDSGFYSQYVSNGVTKYAGLIRDASDGIFNLFTSLEEEPTTVLNKSASGYSSANLQINNLNGTNINMTTDITSNSLNITGNANIKASLTISGTTTIYDTLDVSGNIKSSKCDVVGGNSYILVDSISTTGLSISNYLTNQLSFNEVTSMENNLQHYKIHIRGEMTGDGNQPNISWRAIDVNGEISSQNSYHSEITTYSGTDIVSSSRNTYGELIWSEATTNSTRIFTSILNIWIGTSSRPYDTSIIGECKCYSIDGATSQTTKISSSLTSNATINSNISGIGFISNNSDTNTRFFSSMFRLL
jgi:cytoskeletal protein CcmA (bactofilin family)